MPLIQSDCNFLRGSLAVALLVLAPTLLAQSANPADSAWSALLNRSLPPSARAPVRTAPRSAAQQQQERSEQLSHFLAIADEAKSFGAARGSHTKVAKVLEAKSLLKAAFLGDKSKEPRMLALVGEIEQDQSLSSKDRFEVVALAEHLMLRELAKNPPQARVAREESARYLMREFPDELGGYSALLGAADADGDTAKVRSAAQEVLDAPAPFAAKAKARIMIGRYELIGKSLADVANTALGRGNYFEKTRDKRVLLYTWATWSKSSIAYAKEVVAKAPAGVLVIGYNLDRDVVEAKKAATKERLPGEQYYNEGGPGAWLALLLKLDTAPLVYLTDSRGIIRDVAGQRGDYTARLTAAQGR